VRLHRRAARDALERRRLICLDHGFLLSPASRRRRDRVVLAREVAVPEQVEQSLAGRGRREEEVLAILAPEHAVADEVDESPSDVPRSEAQQDRYEDGG